MTLYSDKIELGTPIKCKKCGYEGKVRLFKGTRIKNLECGNCERRGTMKRNTDFDKGIGRIKE